MHTVPIKVYPIAKTQVNTEEVRRWLDDMGATEFEIPPDDAVTDPALLITLAAKRCYKSFQVGLNPNISKVRTDLVEYIDNILASGHGSVLEHSTWSFAIEGVSRVFTAEMNRHRAGCAISEGSMRYIRFDDIAFWMPDSIQLTQEEKQVIERPKEANATGQMGGSISAEVAQKLDLINKKLASQDVFYRMFAHVEKEYKTLMEMWWTELQPESKFSAKKQITSMMRRIVPMGVATGGVWTLNIRALRHVLTMRCSPAAEEEIFHVMNIIAYLMLDKEPMLFGDYTKNADGFWTPKYNKV